MHKIQKISRFIKWILILAFISLPIVYGMFWYQAPKPFINPLITKDVGFAINIIPADIPIMQPLSVHTKLLAFVVSLIPLSITLVIVALMIQLFNHFQHKEIFSQPNVKIIKKIGIWLIVGQLASMVYDLLISITLTWHNPPGSRVALMSFQGTNIGLLFAALLIILISWIMEEGYQLKEENQYTI